jgi:hypothetical protein
VQIGILHCDGKFVVEQRTELRNDFFVQTRRDASQRFEKQYTPPKNSEIPKTPFPIDHSVSLENPKAPITPFSMLREK